MVRQLVEQDKVLCTFNTLGTPTNTAIHKYMNQKKVPQLFVATGASKWGDPKHFPWTMGFQPDYHTEAVIYAKHILANVKDAKIAVLMQNDDYGKDYCDGFKEGLGKDVGTVVKHVTYETTDPTVDSPDDPAQGLRRQRLLQHRHPEVRRPGDPQGRRHRLEAGAAISTTCRRRVAVDDEAGRASRTSRASSPALYLMDPTDKQWDEQRRHEDVDGVDGQVHAGRQPRRRATTSLPTPCRT